MTSTKVKVEMDAEAMRVALRKRHPAFEPGFAGVGRWTTLTEWQGCDLLALDAWSAGDVVGYEIKVSRSDFRAELLNPSKRVQSVAMTTRFYIATPAGLLKPNEIAFEEPDWEPQDFVRQRCTNPECSQRFDHRGFMKHIPKPRGTRLRGTDREGVSITFGHITDRSDPGEVPRYSHSYTLHGCCVICKGYGTTSKSRVEQEAPTLWIPRDVGLVEVGPRGCNVVKESPHRKITQPLIPYAFIGTPRADGAITRSRMKPEDQSRLQRKQISVFARWISARPDPRHHSLDCNNLDEPMKGMIEMDPRTKEESEQMEVMTPSDRGFLSDDEPAIEQPDDESDEPEEDY